MSYRTFTNGEVLTATHLNTYLMKQANIICTSGTRPSDPVDGMSIYETDTRIALRYSTTAAAWIQDPPRSVEATEASTITMSSETYSAGSPACTVTFTTGRSGRVTVFLSGNIEGFGTEGACLLSYQIYEGTSSSNTHVLAESDGNALMNQGLGNIQATWVDHVTILDPYTQYTARTMHRSATSGENVSVFRRRLTIVQQTN